MTQNIESTKEFITKLQSTLETELINIKIPITFLIQLALGGNVGDNTVPVEITEWAQKICDREQLYPMLTESLHYKLTIMRKALVNVAKGDHSIYKDQIAAMVDNFSQEVHDQLSGSYEDPMKVHIGSIPSENFFSDSPEN